MCHRRVVAWLPAVVLLLAACADGGPSAPADDADLSGDGPLSTVLPDLAPEAGTAGTDRYVPTLERVLRRSVRVIRGERGDEAAGRVVAEARSLVQGVRDARGAGDAEAVTAAVRRLEVFEARVGLRVFGTRLLRHVHDEAVRRLGAVRVSLEQAAAAGRDVSRPESGAKLVRRRLAAAREAANNERPVVALAHAAHALDLVIRVDAALR